MKNAIRALVATCLIFQLACVPALAEGVNVAPTESLPSSTVVVETVTELDPETSFSTAVSDSIAASDSSAESSSTAESDSTATSDSSAESSSTAESDSTAASDSSAESSSTAESDSTAASDSSAESSSTAESDSTAASDSSAESSTAESDSTAASDSSTESSSTAESDSTAASDSSAESSTAESDSTAASDSSTESSSTAESDSADEVDKADESSSAVSDSEKEPEDSKKDQLESETIIASEVDVSAAPKVADGWDSTGTKYYLNGKPVTGWLVTGGQRYWFDGNGNLVKDSWFAKDGSIYYAKPDGKIARGWYGFGVNTFYFDDDGKQQKSWVVTGGERYWFGDNGRLVRNKWFPESGSTYFAKSDGKIARDWNNIGADSFYFNNDGKQQYNYWVVTGGERYHFGQDGRLTKNAWFAQDGNTYLAKVDGKIVRGWYGSGVNTFYFNDDGKQQKAWVVTGGERYWFGDNGRLVRNKWFDVSNNSYYAQANGACARGWVTIGGIQYEFNNDGVYLGNVKNPNGILGIDVSKHQGPIDWAKVRASGIQFAIIRTLGWNSGLNYYEVDPYFNVNMQGAINAGIPVGAYLYSYAFSEAEMLEEINFVLPALNQWKNSFTYPVYIDYEDKLIWEKTQSNEQRTNILRTGMNALAQNGFLPGFYTYYNAATTYINTQQLIDEGYDFWVAHYGAGSKPWSGAGMWQYSSKGSVAGINGNVDMNYAYTDYTKLSKTITVYDTNTGKNVQGKIKDLIPQIVQNEVGSGLGLTGTDKNSLYKAQALAARSYLQFHSDKGNIPTVGLSAPSKDVLSNSYQVMRLGVYYNNSIINAAYGSCAGAYTNSAQNMGWGNYAYLTSVESPYDKTLAPQFYPKTNTIGTATMKNNVIKMVGQAQFNLYANDMSKWITAVNKDSKGNITSAVVCGVTISGGKFYENCWGLYGANLNSWKYNGNGTWTFSSNGNGHGVGLSQYGAAGYIAKGQNWRWVLNHYYPGTSIA